MDRYLFTIIVFALHFLAPSINAAKKLDAKSPGCTTMVVNPGKVPIKKRTVCSDMALDKVPSKTATGATGFVSEFNIDGNSITEFDDASFVTWAEVEKLSVDNNRIRKITEKAFKPLQKLRQLSLSHNRINLNEGMNSKVFNYIVGLERLDLSWNPLGTIPNNFFKHLKRLRILMLNDATNGLKVNELSFVGLRRLETLDLSNNFLRKLPEKGMKNSLSNMSLMNLYLGGSNHWQCDCHLRWLKVWQVQHIRTKVNYVKKEVTSSDAKGNPIVNPTQPICRGPTLVKEKMLFGQDIQITDFQCKPEVRTKPYSFKMRPGVNVTLSCSIFSDPKGPVLWFKDGTLVQDHWKRAKVTQTQGADFRSDLFILNLEPSDAGEWVCEAKNRRGKASTNFTIEVVTPSKDGVLMTRVVLYGGIAAAGLIVFLIAVGIVIYCIYYRRDQAATRAYKTTGQRAHSNHGGGGRRDLVGDAIDGLLDSDPEYHSSSGGVGHAGASATLAATSDGHHALHQHLLDKDGPESVPLTSRQPKPTPAPPPYPANTATIRRVTANPGGPIVHNENCPVHGSRAMMAVAAAAAAFGPCPVHSSNTGVDVCIGGCQTSRSQTPQLISNPVYGTLPQMRAAAAAAVASAAYKPCPLHGDMYATIQKQAAARTAPVSTRNTPPSQPRVAPPQDCATTSFVGEDDDEGEQETLPPPPPALQATSELSDDDVSTLRRNSKSANASTSTGTASSSSSVMAAAPPPPLPPPPPPPPISLPSISSVGPVTSTTTTVTASVSKSHQDDEGYSTAV